MTFFDKNKDASTVMKIEPKIGQTNIWKKLHPNSPKRSIFKHVMHIDSAQAAPRGVK